VTIEPACCVECEHAIKNVQTHTQRTNTTPVISVCAISRQYITVHIAHTHSYRIGTIIVNHLQREQVGVHDERNGARLCTAVSTLCVTQNALTHVAYQPYQQPNPPEKPVPLSEHQQTRQRHSHKRIGCASDGERTVLAINQVFIVFNGTRYPLDCTLTKRRETRHHTCATRQPTRARTSDCR
jgi:hypothetical protein